jgi:hypothetical protein
MKKEVKKRQGKWWITDDEYDRYYQSSRERISDFDARLSLFQETKDNY